MKKFLILLTFASALVACEKDQPKEKVYTSQKVTLHGGKVWSSAKVSKDGKPEQVSIIVDDAAMNSVPVGQPTDHVGHENNLMIPVPQEGSVPFKFIMVNWNSSGHEPENVYTLPHFDFHFYMTPQSEVVGYTDMTKLEIDPAADYLPANHIGGAPAPGMGKHWLDLASPELGGETFTQTFIYGSYDGKVVFYEPMITRDYLLATNSFERDIPQPAKFKNSGYYPTRMKIKRENGVTEVSLEGFIYRQGS